MRRKADGGIGKMISLTSAELNYLIFRYLNESGFAHSAFALGYEAGISKTTIDGNLVPPGALVTFIQKGIQYLELEANFTNDDLDTDEDFQFLNPLDLITKDVNELQKIVKEKKEAKQKEKSKGKNMIENGREHGHGIPMEKDKVLGKGKDNEKQPREKEKIEKEKEKATSKEKEKPLEVASVANPSGDEVNGRPEDNATDIGPEPMDICTSVDSLSYEISSSDVTILQRPYFRGFCVCLEPCWVISCFRVSKTPNILT